MIDETQEELASLYALDLLEGDEKVEFEKALAANPQLAEFVVELRESTTALAWVAKSDGPSPELRSRLMESFAPAQKGGRNKVVRFLTQGPIAWGLAACFAIAALTLQLRYQAAHTEANTLEAEAARARAEIRRLEQQNEAERILGNQQLAELRKAANLANLKVAKLAALTGNSPEALAIAVWNPANQEGVLTVEKLPLIQRDQDYQIWIIDPQYANPVNGGVFTVDTEGRASIHFHPDQPVTGATQFAISLERKGGVPKAEGPIVAIGALTAGSL